RFQNVAPVAGEYLAAKHRGRGLAVGDLNGDGRVDVIISNVNEPVALLVNETPDTNHWLGLKLVGRGSARDAVGAWVQVTTSHGRQTHLVKGGSSYASTSDRTLHFGLKDASQVESVEIHWPSGIVQTVGPLAADQIINVVEPPAP
ncbi:MAG: ASPIC/UnbV domain-containing protein, partial [Planctomycetaceae bacterium]